MAKRMRLIPEHKYRKLMETIHYNDNKSVTNILSKEEKAETILEADIPDDVKIRLYMNLVSEFNSKIDELKSKPSLSVKESDAIITDASNSTHTNPSKKSYELAEKDQNLIQFIPEKFRESAESIFKLLSEHQDLITWDKQGVVTFFKNETEKDTSILDLINFLLRDLKWKSVPKGINRFLIICKKLNIPASLVRSSLREALTSPIDNLSPVKTSSDSGSSFSFYLNTVKNWSNLESESETDSDSEFPKFSTPTKK